MICPYCQSDRLILQNNVKPSRFYFCKECLTYIECASVENEIIEYYIIYCFINNQNISIIVEEQLNKMRIKERPSGKELLVLNYKIQLTPNNIQNKLKTWLLFK
jgi:hypothetical protein